MEFNLSKIKFSNNDLRSNVRIPKKLTPKLAEFIGIMIGDGHIGCYKNKAGEIPFIHYEILVSGNVKDYHYYSKFVRNLAYQLFNIKFRIRKYRIKKQKIEMSITLSRYSKALYQFLSECMGIPQKKDGVRIPACICQAPVNIKSSFLRGLADADFTLSIKRKEGRLYPAIQGVSKSKGLMDDVCSILKQFNINHTFFYDKNYYKKRDKQYPVYRIHINGVKNIRNWFDKVSFSNSRHIKRWEEFVKNGPAKI